MAKEYLSMVLHENQNFKPLLYDFGTYLLKDNVKISFILFKIMKEIYPNDWRVYYHLALCYQQFNKTKQYQYFLSLSEKKKV